ncbi:MAG TPA: hypothetical protein VLN45_12515 [Ignavibacteriaceae bacterium]|nr:hypothetical protein [Ignavibacteriaceae bacterium]
MKKGSLVIYISIVLIIIIGFFFYQYLVKIYETTVIVEPKELFADNQSTVTINVIPLNAFGWKALFRNSPAEFEITEGKSLVEIIEQNKEEGKLILKAKSETGKVVVTIKSKYSFLPMIAEIIIHPNLT